MSLEVRVVCEHPGCEETERAAFSEENFDCSSTVCRADETDRFFFTLDSGWIDGPEGWVLGREDQILCPKHAP
jgi:hypothetical protein